MSKNNEARERCQRSQAKSKITEFADVRKIPLRPAPPQPLLERPAAVGQFPQLTRRESLRARVVKLQSRGVTVPSWLWRALYSVAAEFDRLSEGKEAAA